MPSHEAPAGEKAPIETERKFLVDPTELPEMSSDYRVERICQGYLVIGEDGSEVRIRHSSDIDLYTLTAKLKGDLSRPEREIYINPKEFSDLWDLTEGKRLEKARVSIPYDGLTLEVDVYKGALEGLVTAEVEFPDELTAGNFTLPDWFSTEVTYDKAYKNQQLATKGLPADFKPQA